MAPLPKPPGLRQRRNKVATRAQLFVIESKKQPPPALPKGTWSEEAKIFWRDIWTSPMADEYILPADFHGLVNVALLFEWFRRDPSVKLHAELRAAAAEFGLSPISRRRLQWEKVKVEGRGPRPRSVPARSKDPRSILAEAQ